MDDLLQLAESGDFDALLEALPDAEPGEVYIWLQVMSDFGHRAANDMINGLVLNTLATEEIGHLDRELCARYLRGDGLPRDFEKAARFFEALEEDEAQVARLRQDLSGELLECFNKSFPVPVPNEDVPPTVTASRFDDLIQLKRRRVQTTAHGEPDVYEDIAVLRPCIGFTLIFERPLWQTASTIASALETYLDFVPKGSITAYHSADGGMKKFTRRALNTYTKVFRESMAGPPKPDSGWAYGKSDYTYNLYCCGGELRLANWQVSDYAIEFNADFPTPGTQVLRWEYHTWPDATRLKLDFPIALLEERGPDAFVDLFARFVEPGGFITGIGGYSVNCGISFPDPNRLQREAARIDVGSTYPGFDLALLGARSFRANWLTLVSPESLDRLGGCAQLKSSLPTEVVCRDIADGLLLRAGERPKSGRQGDPSESIELYQAIELCLTEG